jgi:molybdate transport system substrate-binding protein
MTFEQRHPSVEVLPISYDGSSTLATQLIEGAPADVFASADEANMQKIVDAGLADAPRLFASNTLVIAVPAGNPGGVTEIDDLAAAALTVVLCAPEVPCGAASATLLERNEVVVTPASLEQNVTGVLTKVAAGEADAGLVYVTDARGEPRVEAVDAAGAADVVNRYPLAALREAANPAAAAAFVEFVLSGEGRAVLDELGFGAP